MWKMAAKNTVYGKLITQTDALGPELIINQVSIYSRLIIQTTLYVEVSCPSK